MKSLRENSVVTLSKMIGSLQYRHNSSLHLWIIAFALASLTLVGCSDTPIMSEGESEDQTPPTVVSSEPTDESINVAVDSEVTVTFSEEVDEETLNMSFYNPSTNASVRGTTEVSGSTLTFTPDEPLRSGGSYEMLILEVDDLEGNTLEEAFSLVFHTER